MASHNLNTSPWYVATKLHPPNVRGDTINRPLIEEELRRCVSTFPLTLLSAPAGYGKTTLLATISSLLPDYPLAWITLDTEENDPIRFMGLLVTALQKLYPECGRAVWPLISGGEISGSGMKQAMGALINDIVNHVSEPFILVLDDMHFITEPAVYVALDYLFEQPPSNLHVAIGTRHDPPLRLIRLAARRQLGELRRVDLSLGLDESHQLLNETLGLSLTPAEVNILQERTEGWPGALCLLAGPLGRMDTSEQRTQFMATITHTERQALEFLAEEILEYLPVDIRRFLMQTSILAEITPSICQAVTGRDDADEVLAGLYRRNLAIASLTTKTDGEPVYRYHALFSQLLRVQLKRELSGEIRELHRRAAGVQTTPGRAISHYFSAGLWNQAVQLMIGSGMELLHRGMAETVRQWYQGLPAEIRNSHAYLSILMARCEIHRGDYRAAGMLLEQARKDFVEEGDPVGEGDALTSLITICYQADDRASAVKYVDRALELPLDPMGQVAARLGRAWLQMYECNWKSVANNIREALEIPSTTGDRRADIIGVTYMTAPLAAMPDCIGLTERYCTEVDSLDPPDTAWRLGALELGAWPLLWRGQTEEALARAKKAQDLRKRLGGYPFVGNDFPVLLSVLYLAKGDIKAAENAIDTLVQQAEKVSRSKSMFHLHAAGRSLALVGRHAEAQVMEERLASLDNRFLLTRYLLSHLQGFRALVEDNYGEAATILERAGELEAQLPMSAVGGSARLLHARIMLEQGHAEQAVAMASPVLEEWLNASTPGYVLLDGPVILPVLQLVAERRNAGVTGMLGLLSKCLYNEVNAEDALDNMSSSGKLLEPLTPRESDVLKLLVAGGTNQQISAELHISKETVKSHIAHIFRKLDVHSRTQAAMRAKELGF